MQRGFSARVSPTGPGGGGEGGGREGAVELRRLLGQQAGQGCGGEGELVQVLLRQQVLRAAGHAADRAHAGEKVAAGGAQQVLAAGKRAGPVEQAGARIAVQLAEQRLSRGQSFRESHLLRSGLVRPQNKSWCVTAFLWRRFTS